MDRNEIERLYNQYFQAIYRVCFLYMKNEADACDIVQDTFLRLMNCRPVFTDDTKAKAWLIVTASNCCKTQLAKWWRTKRETYDEERMEKLAGAENSEVLRLVLSLEPKYSIPVYLYYYEGYRTAEIARMLKTKASTVQTRLAKARGMLKLEMGGLEI